ncbi:GNAT family N-acetyltransferase [Haloglomus halophilum]|uniref:GNAT family N-acetyltransferase n=1 Tax=Haloglomus halophilum TaxID=2962672 RepID=UPI0020C9CCDB|nr:GNAT family N-acetyltransferase [Haloglomus halophilum]
MDAEDDGHGKREAADGIDAGDTGVDSVRFRRFDPSHDDPADLHALHERALRDAGTDADDVPGTEDLDAIPATYLDGGEFLVGEADGAAPSGIVAMGGFRPASDLSAGGHEGFAGGEADPAAAVELFRIAVAPEMQGHGIGAAMLEELEHRAAGAGFEWVVLTTAARQRAGVELYRSRGYEEVGRLQEGAYELVRFEKRL